MSEPLENLYFNWLCAKVINIRNNTPTLTYWTLLRTLHHTEFVWLLSGDDNRAEDGLELRWEFIVAADLPNDDEVKQWRAIHGCSVLEMLIAFSRRAEFNTGEPAKKWFWEFLTNLGLNEFNDASEVTSDEIGDRLHTFIWRTYDPNGRGGLFPMNETVKDQRSIQLWYQFFEYLTDQEQSA